MAFAEFAKMRSGGPAIAIGLAVALAASLTLAPALLRILGPAVFWPIGLPKRENASQPRPSLWGWLSQQVTARPVTIFVASVVVLLPLAILGFQVHSAYRATGELAPASQSVAGWPPSDATSTPARSGRSPYCSNRRRTGTRGRGGR